jgi:hypothetical protein
MAVLCYSSTFVQVLVGFIQAVLAGASSSSIIGQHRQGTEKAQQVHTAGFLHAPVGTHLR